MDNQAPHLDLLLDLENRHDDLLARLEELDKRVARALADCQAVAPGAAVQLPAQQRPQDAGRFEPAR